MDGFNEVTEVPVQDDKGIVHLPLVECKDCLAVVRRESVGKHRDWHRHLRMVAILGPGISQ